MGTTLQEGVEADFAEFQALLRMDTNGVLANLQPKLDPRSQNWLLFLICILSDRWKSVTVNQANAGRPDRHTLSVIP